jgi:hypothetical protein
MRYPAYLEQNFTFPDFFRVKMRYPRFQIDDIEMAVNRTLDEVFPESGIRAGQRVAIGVGSRGIANLPLIIRVLCRRFIKMGAFPIIIPAMGSHGSATDKGQEDVLETLGITEEFCGAPIRSSLAVKQVGTAFGKVPVWFSQDALKADHSIILNRIKPHTKFKADIESGLSKMLCVGMGKHLGALAYHKWALKFGFAALVKEMAQTVIANTNFRFGIGIVENAYDQTLKIEALPGQRIAAREPALLKMAKAHFPRLPVAQTDVLIIGQIGKEISGSGMDPNVTGRAFDLKESDFSNVLQAARIAILNLSAKAKGNAIGLGNADFITEKVFQETDYEATLMNALTSMSIRKAFIPVRLPDDRKVIQACFTTLGPVPADTVRAVIIRDTSYLSEFWVSHALTSELRLTQGAEMLESLHLRFDKDGNLCVPNFR